MFGTLIAEHGDGCERTPTTPNVNSTKSKQQNNKMSMQTLLGDQVVIITLTNSLNSLCSFACAVSFSSSHISA